MGASSKDNMSTHGERMAHAVGTNKYNINVKMAVAVDGTIIFYFFLYLLNSSMNIVICAYTIIIIICILASTRVV